MAKKRKPKVNATNTEPAAKPVRLVLPPVEHERLERLATRIGLSMSSYARMALIERMKADEAKEVR